MDEYTVDELVKDLKRIAKRLDRPPHDFGEYQASGGKYKHWQFRKRGGFAGIMVMAGFSASEITLAKLRTDNKHLQARIAALEGIAVSSARMREMIMEIDPDSIEPDNDWLKGPQKPSRNHGFAQMLLSDIHFDEVVRPEQIGGCNAYNREVATRRLKNTFRNAVRVLKSHMSSPSYDGIVCNLGGDMLSGNIHEELVETNEACINESILALTEILVEGIGGLADEFGKVFVPCVTGNHGRMHRKPRAKNRAFENFEWLIYQYVARYFKSDPRISFDIPDGPDCVYPLYKRRYLLTHGDQFRGGDGVGGIMVPIMRGASKKSVRQQAIGSPFDVILMGHWHRYIHTNDIIINGSVKGYDEYASQGNFPFEPPQQALWVEHPEYGMTFRCPILCDKGK
jgi:hypothetical protein